MVRDPVVSELARQSNDVTIFSAARKAVEAAQDVREVVRQANKAAILQAASEIDEAKVQWSEIALRAERRLGEMLIAQADAGMMARGGGEQGVGRRGKQCSAELAPHSQPPTLVEAGIGDTSDKAKKRSSRAQSLARMPEQEFEHIIDNAHARKEPIKNQDWQRRERTRVREESQKQEAKDASEITNLRYHIEPCDIRDAKLEPCSIDAVITDPPYPEKDLPTFSYLSEFAAQVLKPGGWCAVMTGNTYLPEVIERLNEHLEYRWQYVTHMPGGPNNRNPFVGLFQSYKPVLLYQKPPIGKLRRWWGDIIRLDADEHNKSLHGWQQSEPLFEKLVERLTEVGESVADPFAGSGTTGRAANKIGRHFWGCDNGSADRLKS